MLVHTSFQERRLVERMPSLCWYFLSGLPVMNGQACQQCELYGQPWMLTEVLKHSTEVCPSFGADNMNPASFHSALQDVNLPGSAYTGAFWEATQIPMALFSSKISVFFFLVPGFHWRCWCEWVSSCSLTQVGRVGKWGIKARRWLHKVCL